jgi:hypothetical protein
VHCIDNVPDINTKNWNYFLKHPLPIRLHGVLLNLLSTRTTFYLFMSGTFPFLKTLSWGEGGYLTSSPPPSKLSPVSATLRTHTAHFRQQFETCLVLCRGLLRLASLNARNFVESEEEIGWLCLWRQLQRPQHCILALLFRLILGRPRFESRTGHRLSWMRVLVVFFRPSRQMPGYYLNYAMTTSFKILSSSSDIPPFVATPSRYWNYRYITCEKIYRDKLDAGRY